MTTATRVETELGIERLCRRCGETWPEDEEFWYFQTRRAGDRYTIKGRTRIRQTTRRAVCGYCRACWSEMRPGRVRPNRVRAT